MWGLEWLYDKVEDRYGRLTAWLTLASGLALPGILARIMLVVLRR